MKKCIGFGVKEGKCDNSICAYSPHWCAECEEKRRKHIGGCFDSLLGNFDRKSKIKEEKHG